MRHSPPPPNLLVSYPVTKKEIRNETKTKKKEEKTRPIAQNRYEYNRILLIVKEKRTKEGKKEQRNKERERDVPSKKQKQIKNRFKQAAEKHINESSKAVSVFTNLKEHGTKEKKLID